MKVMISLGLMLIAGQLIAVDARRKSSEFIKTTGVKPLVSVTVNVNVSFIEESGGV